MLGAQKILRTSPTPTVEMSRNTQKAIATVSGTLPGEEPRQS